MELLSNSVSYRSAAWPLARNGAFLRRGKGRRAVPNVPGLRRGMSRPEAVRGWPAQLPRSLLQAGQSQIPPLTFHSPPSEDNGSDTQTAHFEISHHKTMKAKQTPRPQKSTVGQIPVFLCHLSFKFGFFQASAGLNKKSDLKLGAISISARKD